MAKPVISRDGNVNTLNSDIQSEILYVAPGDNMSDQPFLMDVSERGHAEILDELTDLSANKGAYALREVYSNAHDATVKVHDMSRPIEITIPDIAWQTNSLAEKLAMVGAHTGNEIEYAYVTDHGIGMTEYDLRTYFTQYGGSNKRDDAASIGSKGLGSKAPLAVADFFDVTTSKDGIKTSMHLWRAEDGNYAEVTSSEPCPVDETGTTVRIPVMNPTIGEQMLECAKEIARYNSDANIIVNGKSAVSTLNREVGSASVIDGASYIHIGTIQIGTDGQGNAVSVPVWLARSVFDARVLEPWTRDNSTGSRLDCDYGGVRVVLCGIGYQLVETHRPRSYSYYASQEPVRPVCIAEIEPGYLNFTVSRDEIKDDARKRILVDALREAVDAVNLWPIALRMCAHDFQALSTLMNDRLLQKEGNSWKVIGTYDDYKRGAGYVLTDADKEAFDDADGHSMLPLVATFENSDPDGHDAQLVAWFSSAYNGKSARFHVAYHDDARQGDVTESNWDTDLLSWKYGTDSHRGGNGENSFTANIETIHELVDGVIPTSQIASVVRKGFDCNWSMMVIGGVNAKDFSKAEHSIRRHVAAKLGTTVLQAKILYVLCEGPVSDDPQSPYCLSPAELALTDIMQGHVEVAMLDELASLCAKEDRERRKKNGGRTRRKGPKPLGSFYCLVADIDGGKFSCAEDVVTAMTDEDGIPSKEGGTLRYEVIDLDTLTHDDLVVIGHPGESRAVVIAAQAMLLQKLGKLDNRYDRIVFVPASHDNKNWGKGQALYAPQAKRLGRQVTTLADVREGWAVDLIPSVLGTAGFLTDYGVDIDSAGIRPNDTMRVMIACSSLRVGQGEMWLIKHIDTDFDLAKAAFDFQLKTSAYRSKPVMSIQTLDRSTQAFSQWMSSVSSVIGAYAFSDAISNIGDPDIEFFVRSIMRGVIDEATKAYENEVGDGNPQMTGSCAVA